MELASFQRGMLLDVQDHKHYLCFLETLNPHEQRRLTSHHIMYECAECFSSITINLDLSISAWWSNFCIQVKHVLFGASSVIIDWNVLYGCLLYLSRKSTVILDAIV